MKYNGLFDSTGKQVSGGTVTNSTSGATAGVPLTQSNPGYLDFTIDLTNASAGDKVFLRPLTTYTTKGASKPSQSSYIGLSLTATEKGLPVTVNLGNREVQVGTLDVAGHGSATLTLNENVAEAQGAKVNVKLNVSVADRYENHESTNPQEHYWIQGSTDVQANTGSGFDTLGSIPVVNFRNIFQTVAYDRETYTYTGPQDRNITQDGTVHVTRTRVTTPGGANGTVSLTPGTEGPGNPVPWVFLNDLQITPELYVYNQGDHLESRETLRGMEEINARYPNIRTSVVQNGQTLNMTASGVPADTQISYILRGEGGTGDIALASYLPNGDMYANVAFTDASTGSIKTSTRSIANVPGALTNLPGGTGSEYTRSGDVTASIAGQPKGSGIDTPAPIAGKNATFLFQVKNTGNSVLAAPVVTLPNGEKTVVEGVTIQPGTSGTVSIDYKVPADAQNLNFKVNFAGTTLNPSNDFNFVIGKASPLSGDVTVNGDGTITIQGPDGPITLAPIDKVNEAKKEAGDAKREADKANNRATQLEKDLAAEKARNDADQQKIAKLEKDLAQAKKDAADAAKRAEDAAKKAQSEVDALEKVVADLKANQAADREKIAGLEKQLQDAKDGLKRAQDAATAAQNAATAAQNTANQALADLAKERKRVDDLNKDLATERARVDDLTKRADKAEKDLTDARKRVDVLEKENKAQQGQIDQARKDITALRTEADRLGKELDAATKRVATLEKENKEQAAAIEALQKENTKQQGEIDGLKKENAAQQKQIDTLRSDLTKAEKRVSTLETQLRETQDALAAVSARLGVVESRLGTGLGKCIDTLGGGLLAVVPIIAVLATAANHVQIPGVQEQLTQAQKQMGVYNPQLADFMQKNAGALVAGAGAIAVLGMLLAPNTCRDNTSVGGAIGENLSSGRVTEKANQAAQTEEAQAEDTTKDKVAAK